MCVCVWMCVCARTQGRHTRARAHTHARTHTWIAIDRRSSIYTPPVVEKPGQRKNAAVKEEECPAGAVLYIYIYMVLSYTHITL